VAADGSVTGASAEKVARTASTAAVLLSAPVAANEVARPTSVTEGSAAAVLAAATGVAAAANDRGQTLIINFAARRQGRIPDAIPNSRRSYSQS
jgi:hypothetical protein